MDIEAFSSDAFDAAYWINQTLKSDDQQDKTGSVLSLVSKLQQLLQFVNSSLEENSQQVIANLPCLLKDALNLKNETLGLRTKMSEVQNEIAIVQRNTGACMINLERLDTLKTKLQTAKEGLQESDGWGKLSTELEDLLEKNNVESACDKLRLLERSLAAQSALPGQSERELQVEGFKNKLEALASPIVVKNLSAADIEQSKKDVAIFQSMHRFPQLQKYYRMVQKSILQEHWVEVTELSESVGSMRLIREFYEYLYDNYQKQSRWSIQVFGSEGASQPIQVLIELLETLQPTRESVISNALKRSNEKITILQEVSSANLYFWHLMEKSQNILNFTFPSDTLVSISNSIFGYFNIFIGQYGAIEQNLLGTYMVSIKTDHNSSSESIRALTTAMIKVFESVDQAIKRCQEITQSCAIAPLVVVLNTLLNTFLDKFKKAQRQLQASQSSELDLSLLQICITLLQSLGDFKVNLENVESQILQIVVDTYGRLYANDCKSSFMYEIVGQREINDFKILHSKIKDYQKNAFGEDNTKMANLSAIFNSVMESLVTLCKETHDTTLASIFLPVEVFLKSIKEFDSYNSSGDLPDFSFAPQEYITQVGQYLLTLPQHLEPLLLSPSPSLQKALDLTDERYSRNAASADVLLALLAEECCAVYQHEIGQIASLTSSGSKQLATDIEYLGSVLEELGLTLGSYLQQAILLLRAPAENYLCVSSGCDPRLVTSIRQKRSLQSTD